MVDMDIATPHAPAATPPRDQLHVLVSAYMCEPNRGSEPGKSWNWVEHLAAHCRLSVLTQGFHRTAIDARLERHPLPNVRFHYVDGPPALRAIGYKPLRYHLNYIAWQQLALRRATQLLAADPFQIAHHISFASLSRPIFMHQLPVPLVFGPVGGGELGHAAFWGGGGASAYGYEWLRSNRVRLMNLDPMIQSTLRHAARIVLTTPENMPFIPAQHHNKVLFSPPSGIESHIARRPIHHAGNGRRIYTAGRLVHWKGFHLAIRAFARVARHFPDASFTILGDGPQRERLETLIAAEGVGGQVRIERWLPRDEVLRIAAESDIFLFPSLHDSGGTAVFEAMAAAKPVICLDSGGPGLSVTPSCGFKIPLTTPEHVVGELANALATLLGNPELQRSMGMAARQRVLDEYIWERRAAWMANVYSELVPA